MKRGFGDRPAAHHVHVNDSSDSAREFGLRIQERGGAFDLRRPDKSQRARGPRELAFVDQLLNRSRDFKNGDAAAGVVVRAGALMIQVATIGDFFVAQFRVGAGNRRRDNAEHARVLARFHNRVHANLLAARQTIPQGAGRLQRQHKRERLIAAEGFQMAPAHKILVFARPRGALILGVAHDAGRAMCADREMLHRAGLRGNEHELAANVFASVIGLVGAFAHVHEIGRHVAAFTIFGERYRHGLPACDAHGGRPRATLLAEFPKFGEIGVPGQSRFLRSVDRLAVGGKFEDLRIAQPIGPCPLEHQLGCGAEAARAAHAMLARDAFEIAFGGFAGELLIERGYDGAGEQRRLLRLRGIGRLLRERGAGQQRRAQS